MPEDTYAPNFSNRLRMDNLYPSLPNHQVYDDTWDRFVNQVLPLVNKNQGALQRVGQQALQPPMNEVGDGRPGNVTKANVVYQPSIGDIGRERAFSREAYGEDLDPNAYYKQAQLGLRQQEINQRGQQLQATNQLNQGKLANSELMTRIAADRARYQGSHIIAPKGGEIKLVGPDGTMLANYGATGDMDESARIGLEQNNAMSRITAQGENQIANTRESGGQARQTQKEGAGQRESLADIQARHAIELAEAKQKEQLPSQDKIETSNRAQLAADTHPEWQKYIVKTPGGGYYIKPTGMMNGVFSGPDAATRKAISDFINGSETGTQQVTKPIQSTGLPTRAPVTNPAAGSGPLLPPSSSQDPLGLRKR